MYTFLFTSYYVSLSLSHGDIQHIILAICLMYHNDIVSGDANNAWPLDFKQFMCEFQPNFICPTTKPLHTI